MEKLHIILIFNLLACCCFAKSPLKDQVFCYNKLEYLKNFMDGEKKTAWIEPVIIKGKWGKDNHASLKIYKYKASHNETQIPLNRETLKMINRLVDKKLNTLAEQAFEALHNTATQKTYPRLKKASCLIATDIISTCGTDSGAADQFSRIIRKNSILMKDRCFKKLYNKVQNDTVLRDLNKMNSYILDTLNKKVAFAKFHDIACVKEPHKGYYSVKFFSKTPQYNTQVTFKNASLWKLKTQIDRIVDLVVFDSNIKKKEMTVQQLTKEKNRSNKSMNLNALTVKPVKIEREKSKEEIQVDWSAKRRKKEYKNFFRNFRTYTTKGGIPQNLKPGIAASAGYPVMYNIWLQLPSVQHKNETKARWLRTTISITGVLKKKRAKHKIAVTSINTTIFERSFTTDSYLGDAFIKIGSVQPFFKTGQGKGLSTRLDIGLLDVGFNLRWGNEISALIYSFAFSVALRFLDEHKAEFGAIFGFSSHVGVAFLGKFFILAKTDALFNAAKKGGKKYFVGGFELGWTISENLTFKTNVMHRTRKDKFLPADDFLVTYPLGWSFTSIFEVSY